MEMLGGMERRDRSEDGIPGNRKVEREITREEVKRAIGKVKEG